MSNPFPKRNKKTKGQPSPASVFILAFMAFIFDAPFGLVLFLLGVGFIVWRMQKAANKMAKLPPLPTLEEEQAAGTTIQWPPQSAPSPLESQSHDGLNDTTWGRHEPSDTRLEPVPKPVTSPVPPPVFKSEPIATAPSSTTASLPRSEYDPVPVNRPIPANPIPTLSIGTPTVRPKRRATGSGINLATEAGLRQAVIAMTVLGPCRALSPYQDEEVFKRQNNAMHRTGLANSVQDTDNRST